MSDTAAILGTISVHNSPAVNARMRRPTVLSAFDCDSDCGVGCGLPPPNTSDKVVNIANL